MTTRMVSKSDWRSYLDQVSKDLVGRRAEIDVMSMKLGSQVQAQWIRLLGITYDPKNDLLEVALDGLDVDGRVQGARRPQVEQQARGLDDRMPRVVRTISRAWPFDLLADT